MVAVAFELAPLGGNLTRAESDRVEKKAAETPQDIDEEPADDPEMDAVQSLREHVTTCEHLYKTAAAKAAIGAVGGDPLSLAQLRYRHLSAKARLCWAEGKWVECHKEAVAAVRAAKRVDMASNAWHGGPPDMRHDDIARAESHLQLTEARLFLAKVTAKQKEIRARQETPPQDVR